MKRSPESVAASAAGCSKAWTPERRAAAAQRMAARNKAVVHVWDDERRAKLVQRNKKMWTPERKARNGVRVAERNKTLKPAWTQERRERQAEVARRVNAARWGERTSDTDAASPLLGPTAV